MGEDSLAPYFVAAQRHSPQLGGRDGFRGHVDALVNELRIPCSLDPDGDWGFQSDVGPMLLVATENPTELTLIQVIQTLERRPKHHADDMLALLKLNFETTGGARFAAIEQKGEIRLVLTDARRAEELDRGSLERMLADCMHESRRIDELLGNAPPAAQPQAGNGAFQQADARLVAAEQGGGAGALPAQQAAAPAAVPAGWHPDPQGQARLRWWDGARWTEHTAQ